MIYRYGKYNWVAIDAFRGDVPYARTDWDRPNTNQTLSWTSTLSNTLVNEASYTYGLDEVFINVLESDAYKRSTYGVTYPYLFPQNKEIADKLPTISIDNLGLIDGGPYPAFSRGPIHTFSNTTTWVKSRHTFKGGMVVEYSGEDDFDQINVQPIPGSTNNQNGRFEFRNSTSARSGLALSDAALGLFTNYAEIGQRALTKWRATATDFFVQDSWRPTAKVTVEGGVRYVLWPPWYSTTNNIASFDPNFYNRSNEAIINPSTGVITGGPRYNGIVLPGDGFPSEASDLAVYNDPAVNALFVGVPRGFTKTYKDVFEPRGGVSYAWDDRTVIKASAGVFHQRVTLNDSLLPGGNPPFQPQVSVSNGSADNPGGAGGAAALPLGMTAIDPEAKIPVAYTYSAGVQRQMPFGFIVDVTYVGRQGRNLQRERNINQPPPARFRRNPGINIAALRPYKGYGVIRLSEHEATREVQLAADRRRLPLSQRLQVRRRLHAGQVDGRRQQPARRAVQRLRRLGLLGSVQLRSPPRVQLLLHLRPAVLHRPDDHAGTDARRLADLRLHLHAHRHPDLGHTYGRHRRRRRCLRAALQPGEQSVGRRQR